LLLVIFLLFPANSIAGSFKVVPIKLSLDARTKTAVLKITNEGTEKVTVQLDVKEWNQDDKGIDRYNPTKDIIFFPEIVSIDKGEEWIIRIGYQGKSGAREKTYRLLVQELPLERPGKMALRFALRFSVPIFIKPQEETKKKAIEKLELKGGRLLVRVKNSGYSHFMVSKIKARGLDESKDLFSTEMRGWYVLAGVSKIYALDIPEGECMKASLIKVEVEVEKTSMDARVDVDRAQCQRPKEQEKR
jgi:fimbrial chaperone protein